MTLYRSPWMERMRVLRCSMSTPPRRSASMSTEKVPSSAIAVRSLLGGLVHAGGRGHRRGDRLVEHHDEDEDTDDRHAESRWQQAGECARGLAGRVLLRLADGRDDARAQLRGGELAVS